MAMEIQEKLTKENRRYFSFLPILKSKNISRPSNDQIYKTNAASIIVYFRNLENGLTLRRYDQKMGKKDSESDI